MNKISNNPTNTIVRIIPENKGYLHVMLNRADDGWRMQCPELFEGQIDLGTDDMQNAQTKSMQLLHNIVFQKIRELQLCAQAIGASLSGGISL